ncbi:MAG: YceI family protein [candidate division WOR-3 bacterium]
MNNFLILYLFIQLPSKFFIEEGFVKYRVDAKAFFGMMTHTIEGRNDSIKGEFIKDGDKIEGKIIIKSSYFVSGNSRRDKDVSFILESQKFKEIIFEPLGLDTVKVKEAIMKNKGNFFIKGKLTVKGVSKVYDLNVLYEKERENSYLLKTEIKSKFTDFGIRPPEIKGLGAFGRVITYAPDEIFLSGIVKIKVIR